jgi:hypothetical protein
VAALAAFNLFREWNAVEFPKLPAFREFCTSFPKQLSYGHNVFISRKAAKTQSLLHSLTLRPCGFARDKKSIENSSK